LLEDCGALTAVRALEGSYNEDSNGILASSSRKRSGWLYFTLGDGRSRFGARDRLSFAGLHIIRTVRELVQGARWDDLGQQDRSWWFQPILRAVCDFASIIRARYEAVFRMRKTVGQNYLPLADFPSVIDSQ
jgi:hypothetical protein